MPGSTPETRDQVTTQLCTCRIGTGTCRHPPWLTAEDWLWNVYCLSLGKIPVLTLFVVSALDGAMAEHRPRKERMLLSVVRGLPAIIDALHGLKTTLIFLPSPASVEKPSLQKLYFGTFMLHATADCLPPMPMQTSPEGETLLIRTLAAIHVPTANS